MNDQKPIFPFIKITEGIHTISFETYLRKPHRKFFLGKKKYYLWHHFKISAIDINDKYTPQRDFYLQDFLGEVYKTILFGKVNPNIIYAENRMPVFQLDPDQTSEYNKLFNLWN